ncbi:MAG: NADH-quinone oxidoreductase subunit J, partial [Actinobacteria bacterium]|nr:NADH-quinone oxidoreductase subunit J [Actinomycetota bacterium]
YVAVRGDELISAVDGGQAALEELNRRPGNVEALARVLFGDYLLPFEVTSVLLVAAVVGVMVLARRMENLGDIRQIETRPIGQSSTADEDRGSSDRATEEVS